MISRSPTRFPPSSVFIYSQSERPNMATEPKLILLDAARREIRSRLMSIRTDKQYVYWVRAFRLLSRVAPSGQDGCHRGQWKVARRSSARTFMIANPIPSMSVPGRTRKLRWRPHCRPETVRIGFGSDFGLRKPLRIFDFRAPAATDLPTRFGIRSDFGFIGRRDKKTRYVSSAFGTELVIF